MSDNNDITTAEEISTTEEIKTELNNIVDFKKLPFSSKAKIVWSFFWRGIIVSICSALSGGILGGISGATLGLIFSKNAALEPNVLTIIQAVGGVFGLICGVIFFYVYIRWLLTSRLGKFRLLLVLAD